MQTQLALVESLGGEGLMLRQPGSLYQVGRSSTLLKVKRFHDAEAVIVGYEAGKGRHRGRIGALLVEMANGIRFAVGTGLTDAQRENPPAVGSAIRFRYQGLTDGGVPRFASYVGLRVDNPDSPTRPQGEVVMPVVSATQPRRFEFRGGTSCKFWEISVSGIDVTVRFGRIGSQGQTNVKSFSNKADAAKHAEHVVRAKLAKGYVEVG